MATANEETQPAMRQFDYAFKVLLVGDSNVGKTCLVMRYCDNSFTSTFMTTIGIDFKIKTLVIEGRLIKLQIWDTAGHERYRSLTMAYYRGATGIIFVYDVTSLNTFENVKQWLDNSGGLTNSDVERLILGNKCDLEHEREVKFSDAGEFSRSLAIPLLEVSAKTGERVDEAFMLLARAMKKSSDLKHYGAFALNKGGRSHKSEDKKQSESTTVKINKETAKKSCPC